MVKEDKLPYICIVDPAGGAARGMVVLRVAAPFSVHLAKGAGGE
jgi:hypothetical protein